MVVVAYGMIPVEGLRKLVKKPSVKAATAAPVKAEVAPAKKPAAKKAPAKKPAAKKTTKK